MVRCQGKCRVYSLRARKDAVEALPLVVSFWLEVSAKLQGLPRLGKQCCEGLPVAGQLLHWQGAQARVGMEGGAFGHSSQNSCH